jgi:hypothetical protein
MNGRCCTAGKALCVELDLHNTNLHWCQCRLELVLSKWLGQHIGCHIVGANMLDFGDVVFHKLPYKDVSIVSVLASRQVAILQAEVAGVVVHKFGILRVTTVCLRFCRVRS